MAKRQAKNIQVEEYAEDADPVALMALAYEQAKKLFNDVTPAVVFGVYDSLAIDGVDAAEQTEDLLKACTVASELFEVPTPTPDMVFGVFERLFPDDEHDED